jgi:hypothetical protein
VAMALKTHNGGNRTLAFRQFGAAPRAESDPDYAVAAIVDD